MKKNPKLTKWFSADVKPARSGVYEFRGFPAPYHYFNGKEWCGAATDPQHRSMREWKLCMPLSKSGCTYHLDAQWRGLAENPEK